MPRVTITVGGRERLNPTISKGTQLLPTDALVWIDTTCIKGTATTLRALADALIEAADLAEEYDADPDGWNQREQAERATDH
jgi:hypothetical protein